MTRCKNGECFKLFHIVPTDKSFDMIHEQLLVDRSSYGMNFLLELECPYCKVLFYKDAASLAVCDCGQAMHETLEPVASAQ